MIIGIDPSLTSTGIVVLDRLGNLIDHKAIQFRDKLNNKVYFNLERFNYTLTNIDIVLHNYAEKGVIAIEGFAYGAKQKTRSLIEFGALGWMIRKMWYDKYRDEYKLIIIQPTQLKQFIGEKGNCKKERMILKVWQKYNIEFKTNDETDAYGLAQMGLAYYNITNKIRSLESYKTYEQKALNKVLKGEENGEKKED